MVLYFDTYAKEYRMTLSKALSHKVSLGSDIHGNITRLDNTLEGLAASLRHYEQTLENTQAQMETAKSEVLRPFPQEQEYQSKSARLRELTSLLNIGEKEGAVFDSEPEETHVDLVPIESLER